MSKPEFYLNKIICYGLYAVLLTPLAFWPPALYAFLTTKFILFQVLVEIIFAAWLILLARKGFRDLCKNYVVLALLGFIAFSLISAVFGMDFSRSFWGIGARMTGLFAEIHFLAWFIVLTNVFADSVRRTKEVSIRRTESISASAYLNFSFAVSILVALSAFYQNTGWRLVYGSTFFNNPTFAAPYFLFHFFWGLYQYFSSRDTSRRGIIFRKLFFGAGSILILIALLLGEVRGAIIGLVAGILFLGTALILSNILSRRRRISVAVCCLLLLLGAFVFWQLRGAFFFQNNDLLKKFSEISTTTTAQTRILLWQTSLKVFFDRPLLGAGPENYNYLFNNHYDPRFLKYGGNSFDETWQDKPHNAFLEVLDELGLVGALIYLTIWFAVAFLLFKIFKNGQKFLALILGGAFITYLGTVFFSFDSFGSWFGLYLMLGFVASRTNIAKVQESRMPPISSNFYPRLMISGIILVALILIWANLSIWNANIADADALRIFSKNPVQGIDLFKKSLSYWTPYKSEYQFDLIASVAGAIEKRMPLPNLEDTINFSLDEADKAVAAHPKDAAKYADMAKIYNILGAMGRDPGILAQAETFGKRSLELSPNRQETLFYLARTALLKNDFESAVGLTKRAVDVDPGISLSHWYLGLSYIANNQKSEGINEINRALELGYKPQNETEKSFIRNLGF